MSNHRPHIRRLFVTALLLGGAAAAQSSELIEAVRVHRPTALSTARAELSACLATVAKAPACADAERLSLLTGMLQL
ncbi:MAG: hypothetical protein H6Q89_5333, partial [Myxococcaceae bacterium]|nr:hypothetical protein [Myxococcaceae bacterium]